MPHHLKHEQLLLGQLLLDPRSKLPRAQNPTGIAPPGAFFEDLLAETASLALAARSVNIREKLHFDLFKSLAAAGLAPAPFDVERKGGGGITPQAREVGGGKETPDGVEDLHVGCRVGAGSCP